MRNVLSYMRLVAGLVMVIVGTLLIPLKAAAQGNPPLQFIHYPCAFGARLAPGTCIYGSVFDKAALSLDRQLVRAQWKYNGKDYSLNRYTRRRPTDPQGAYGFVISLPPELPPGTKVKLSTNINGRMIRREIILSPDPVTLSQRVDLLAKQGDLPQLVGRAFQAGQITPTGATVELRYTTTANQQRSVTVTTSQNDLLGEEIFGFKRDITDQIKIGSQVVISATSILSPTLSQQAVLTWERQATLIDLYLDWACDYTSPTRSPKSLPPRFCIAGKVTQSDGEPKAGAEVVLSLGSESILLDTTAITTGSLLKSFNYAVDVGSLIEGHGAEEEILISAVSERATATTSIKVGTIQNQLASGIFSLIMPLQILPDWLDSSGLQSRSLVLARAELPNLRALLIRGSGLWLSAGGEPWRSPSPYQPCREGNGLFLTAPADGAELPLIECRDASNAIYRSINGGRSWQTAGIDNARLMPTLPTWPDEATGALSVTEIMSRNDLDYVATEKGLFSSERGLRNFETLTEPFIVGPRITAPGPVRGMTFCGDTLYILTPQSLYSVGANTQLTPVAGLPPTNLNGRSLITLPNNSLVVGRSSSSQQVWLGANCGQSWSVAPAFGTAAVSDLIADESNRLLVATDRAGLWAYDGAAWVQISLENVALSALARVGSGPDCRIFAAAQGTGAGIYTLTCAGGLLNDPQALPAQVSALSDLDGTVVNGTPILFAVGGDGLYKRVGADVWLKQSPDVGPLRLLSVALSPNYVNDRQVLVGGRGTGLLTYRDISPEVRATVEVEPLAARPGEPFTITVSLQNIGGSLARTVGGSLLISPTIPLSGAITLADLNLAPGAEISRTLTGVVPLTMPVGADPSFIFQATGVADNPDNNRDEKQLVIWPVKGADLHVSLSVGARQDSKVVINYDVANLGELIARQATLAITVSTDGVFQSTGQTSMVIQLGDIKGIEESDGSCEKCRGKQTIVLPIKSLNLLDRIITATVSTNSTDRDLENNQAVEEILDAQQGIEVLIVTNTSRQDSSRNKVIQEVKTTRETLQRERGMTSRVVDAGPSLNKLLSDLDKLLNQRNTGAAIAINIQISEELRKFIWEKVEESRLTPSAEPTIKYVVLVGGDRVLPYGVVQSTVASKGDGLKESAFILDRRDTPEMERLRLHPVYSTLSYDYYPSDDIYGISPSTVPDLVNLLKTPVLPSLVVARLVETPTEIHATLKAFNDGERWVEFRKNLVVGYDLALTKDNYDEACKLWDTAYSQTTCEASLKDLKATAVSGTYTAVLLGGHGDPATVGDVRAEDLVNGLLKKEKSPFALALACHTGLSIDTGSPTRRTLPAAITSAYPRVNADRDNWYAGGVLISSIPYAYSSVGSNSIAYSERLSVLIQENAMRMSGKYIGDALLQAKADYLEERNASDTSMTDLDWKVLWGTALYGLPFKEIRSTALAQVANRNGVTADPTLIPIPGTALFSQVLSLPLSPTLQPDPSGWASQIAYYNDSATSWAPRIGERSSVQPYWQKVFEPLVLPNGDILIPRGVRLVDSAYDLPPAYDPAIAQAMALQGSNLRLTEPDAASIKGWEHTLLLGSAQLKEGRLLARLWLGQFGQFGSNGVERLLRNPQIAVIYGAAEVPPPLAAPAVFACRSNGQIAVQVAHRSDLAEAWLTYTNTGGSWQSVPMLSEGNALTARIPDQAGLEFFVQAIDKGGRVFMINKNRNSYFTTADATCIILNPQGLIARYEFTEGGGSVVKDSSGVGAPLDLKIENSSRVSRRSDGLEIKGATHIASPTGARKITLAARNTHELTVEAIVTPAEANQFAARIVELAASPTVRNFSLVQGYFDRNEPWVIGARLRTDTTAPDGMSMYSSPGSIGPRKTHIVFTRDDTGEARIYIDGTEVARWIIEGDFDTWDVSHRLILGNTDNGVRSWRGIYHFVAIYNRAISSTEVESRFINGKSR